MQYVAIKKLDVELNSAEIEAVLQWIEEIQGKDPVARDHASGEHPVATVLLKNAISVS